MSAGNQRTFAEAEAVALLFRAQGQATAFENTITDAANALRAAGADTERDAHRVLELHRLVTLRLSGLIRRIGEHA